MRAVINFNDNWTFHKPGETAEPVTLPHTWNAIDGQDGGNDYWRGTASYEKHFARPELKDGERCFRRSSLCALILCIQLRTMVYCR